MKRAFVLCALGLLLAGSSWADETLSFCYNWGCAEELSLEFSESFLLDLGGMLIDADSPMHERELLAVAIGRIYGDAAGRSLLAGDRAGNSRDDEAEGRMDCVDHTRNTSTMLKLFERRGWMRFHRFQGTQWRLRKLIFSHQAAVVEELPPGLGVVGGDSNEQFVGERYVVDSWFVDPGQAALILPLEDWNHGGGPDVE